MSPSSEMEGCSCLFPDSVFFGEDGKPSFIAKSDKNDKLSTVTNRLGLSDIRQKFSVIWRDRKKETKTFLVKVNESKTGTLEQTSARKAPAPPAAEEENNQAHTEKKSALYQDTAMVRFRTNNEVKVLKDNEFINEFSIRPNDGYWKTIEVVQTCTKSKTGSGQPIFVHFFAPLNEDSPNDEVHYDLSHFPSDSDLI